MNRIASAAAMAGVAATTVLVGGSPASASVTHTCTAVGTTHQPAPAVGASATVQAAPGGSYVVSRPATTTLSVSSVSAATGWSGTASIPTGTRVRVSFTSTTSTDVYRFTSKLNATGTSLITHAVHCV